MQEKLKNNGLDDKERMKLELEIEDVKKQEEEYQKKEKELAEKEKNEPWNVDTIGHEAFSKSVLIYFLLYLFSSQFCFPVICVLVFSVSIKERIKKSNHRNYQKRRKANAWFVV